MNEMQFLEALGEISDDLIEEAAPERKLKHTKKPIWRTCVAAACMTAAALAVGTLGHYMYRGSEKSVIRGGTVMSEPPEKQYSLGGTMLSGGKIYTGTSDELLGGGNAFHSPDDTNSSDGAAKEDALISQETEYRGDVSDMKEVTRAVTDYMKTEEFRAMTTDEKASGVYGLLTQLAENGTENAPRSLILKDSIIVSADSTVISYRYPNGNIAVINLSENSGTHS